MGLLHDDAEAVAALEWACRNTTSLHKLCGFSHNLWSGWKFMTRHFSGLHSLPHFNTTIAKPVWNVHNLVDEQLALYNCSLSDFGIPPPAYAERAHPELSRAAQEYARELRNPDEMWTEHDFYERLLPNDDQGLVFNTVQALVDGTAPPNAPNIVYIDGPAGAGKTHIYKKIIHYVRSSGRVALAVAMAGIAALLLPGGRTAHSRFRLPVPVPLEGCKSNIKPNTVAAKLIMDAAVIIWDEAPTASKAMFEAVDTCLRELIGCDRPFGGRAMVLGGDFRQIPPVLRYIDREAVVNHTLAALPWWGSDSVRIFRLARNMRASFDVAYADFCLQVGDGTLPAPPFGGVPKDLLPCVVELPAEVLAPSDWDAERLLHWVYEGFDQIPEAQWFQYYANRTVVTPTNETCQELNKLMVAHLDAATEICSFSHDTACTEVDSGETYSTEFLNSLETGGLPPHELRIRHGSLVILLRNFAPHKGLCNGTRLVVQKMHKHVLAVHVVARRSTGNVEMPPRMRRDSRGDCELSFALRKRQCLVPYLGFCLEGSYSLGLKGPGSATRPGRFPQTPPRGSPRHRSAVPPG